MGSIPCVFKTTNTLGTSSRRRRGPPTDLSQHKVLPEIWPQKGQIIPRIFSNQHPKAYPLILVKAPECLFSLQLSRWNITEQKSGGKGLLLSRANSRKIIPLKQYFLPWVSFLNYRRKGKHLTIIHFAVNCWIKAINCKEKLQVMWKIICIYIKNNSAFKSLLCTFLQKVWHFSLLTVSLDLQHQEFSFFKILNRFFFKIPSESSSIWLR